MHKFNIGDKVRLVAYGPSRGTEGIITHYNEHGHAVFTVTKAFGGFSSVGEPRNEWDKDLALIEEAKPENNAVEHPSHYGGKDDPYEVIKVAEAWGFDEDAYLFNVLKYIARADKKGATLEDHKKASFYLNRKIKQLEKA